MNNKVTVHDAEGNVLNIEILATFRIEELTKQYVIYTLNDEEEIMPITQDRINEMFHKGLRTLSKTRRKAWGGT